MMIMRVDEGSVCDKRKNEAAWCGQRSLTNEQMNDQSDRPNTTFSAEIEIHSLSTMKHTVDNIPCTRMEARRKRASTEHDFSPVRLIQHYEPYDTVVQ
jgi:hypothetical protein